jgi:hypothetical protein
LSSALSILWWRQIASNKRLDEGAGRSQAMIAGRVLADEDDVTVRHDLNGRGGRPTWTARGPARALYSARCPDIPSGLRSSARRA